MAALSLTAANLDGTIIPEWDTGALAGVALTAGQAVYRDSNNLIQLCAMTSATVAQCIGIVSTAAVSAGQRVFVYTNDCIITGFPTLVAGTPYYTGAAGAIIPFADYGTGNYMTQLGYAETTTSFHVWIKITGLVKA